jgi:hypothetical protein
MHDTNPTFSRSIQSSGGKKTIAGKEGNSPNKQEKQNLAPPPDDSPKAPP